MTLSHSYARSAEELRSNLSPSIIVVDTSAVPATSCIATTKIRSVPLQSVEWFSFKRQSGHFTTKSSESSNSNVRIVLKSTTTMMCSRTNKLAISRICHACTTVVTCKHLKISKSFLTTLNRNASKHQLYVSFVKQRPVVKISIIISASMSLCRKSTLQISRP